MNCDKLWLKLKSLYDASAAGDHCDHVWMRALWYWQGLCRERR